MVKPLAFAAFALLSVASTAQAGIVIDSSYAIQGTSLASGLSGTYRHVGAGSTNFTIADTLAAMRTAPVGGTFTTTAMSYSGSDRSSITSFLGKDGASYKGATPAANDMSDAILQMSGYLYVAAPGTISFAVTHDDNAQLRIANQIVISGNCCSTDTQSVTFGAAGFYAINAIYSNTVYNGGSGGASFAVAANGTVLGGNSLAQAVPEPASAALLGLAMVGLGAVGYRRRDPKATA